MAGHNPDFTRTRGDDARAIRPDQPAITAIKRALNPHHIQNRNALSDTDDQRHSGIDRLKNGIGGKWWRHIDNRGIGLGLLHRADNRIKNRQIQMRLPALTRSDTANHVGAISNRLFGMECSLSTGKALTDDPCLTIYKN